MNNSKKLHQNFVQRITVPEDANEISSIGYLVFEHLFGLSKTEVLAHREISLSPEDASRLNEIITRINSHEPIQYILASADFFGRSFFVNKDVLIPRPETEELVIQAVQCFMAHKMKAPTILDIGTGSGCISITLSLEMPGATVHATDVSDDALAVARRNAKALNAPVNFFHHDILKQDLVLKDFDMIISNPPYIGKYESLLMKKNVVDHEPHLALFVSDDDVLVFYRVIAQQAMKALKPGGMLLMEINERLGGEVSAVFSTLGLQSVALVKDVSGKDRIIKAVR